MSKKLFIRLAPLVAIAAFAVVPAVAQGSPHYWKNSFTPAGEIKAGEELPVLAWGTLTLTPNPPSTAKPTSCENSSGGFVENDEGNAGAAAGTGQTSNFASWNCSNAGCPAGPVEFPPTSGKFVEKEMVVFPGGEKYAGQSLPWPSELNLDGALIRSSTTGVIVVLGCIAQKTPEISPPGEDEPQFLAAPTVCVTTPGNLQNPVTHNNTQIGGTLTSFVEFDGGATGTEKSGQLLCEPGAGAGIEFEGKTKGKLKVFGYNGQEIIKTRDP